MICLNLTMVTFIVKWTENNFSLSCNQTHITFKTFILASPFLLVIEYE